MRHNSIHEPVPQHDTDLSRERRMTATGDARRLEEHLWLIDTLHQGQPGVVASYLLDGPHGLGLVDVGSGATVENLLAGVRAAGFDPRQIEHILLTHIH